MLRYEAYGGAGMAAGRSNFGSARRGARTGQGAETSREGQAPLPFLEVRVPALDSVGEICGWLGTFNERLRLARVERVQAAELT
jgi:hypothetical protein